MQADLTTRIAAGSARRGSKETGAPAPTAPEARLTERRGHPGGSGQLEPARPDIFNFRFAAGREFKAKFTRLAEVLTVENPVRDMAEILERAIDLALERKDPQKKRERRIERESRRSEAGILEKPHPDKAAAEPASSRALPAAARERVLARAGYRCE